MKDKIYFFKSTKSVDKVDELSLDRVIENFSKGIETSIILDTNIYIIIKKIVQSGNTIEEVKKEGLDTLVDFLINTPPYSVCVSPGFAMYEVPPGLRKELNYYYELFCKKHLPTYIDTPNSTRSKWHGKRENYTFYDLGQDEQYVLSMHYISLILLNLVDRKKKLAAVEKFKLYIELLEKNLIFLSSKEIEISKYCFSEPSSDLVHLIKTKKVLRKNFLKTNKGKLPKTSSEFLSLCLNGARDLILLFFADALDTNGLQGVKQDAWIVTKDEKLVEFTKIFSYVGVNGDVGKYIALELSNEQANDAYWKEVSKIHMDINYRREHTNSINKPKRQVYEDVIKIVNSLTVEVLKEFDEL